MIGQFLCLGTGVALGIAVATAVVRPGVRYALIVFTCMLVGAYVGALK